MRELTEELPKPMIPVRGKPILLHIIEGLRSAGIERVQIIVGYRAEVVRDFFGSGSAFGVAVEYATQVEISRLYCPTGTFLSRRKTTPS